MGILVGFLAGVFATAVTMACLHELFCRRDAMVGTPSASHNTQIMPVCQYARRDIVCSKNGIVCY